MPFGIAVVIVALTTWRLAGWRHAATIEMLKHRLQLRDDQIAELQRRDPAASALPVSQGQHSAGLREAARPTEKAFVGKSVTPQSLMRLCRDKTLVQAESAVGIYLGKWMRVSGAIAEVARVGPAIEVSLEIPSHEDTTEQLGQRLKIGLSFEGHATHVEALDRGDILTAVGRIDKIRTYTLALHECEFVSTE